MRNTALTLTITISVILGAILLMDSVNNVNTDFSDYEEMQSSGIFERGWVPEYLPKSSTNISEHHNIDTNRIHISFDYDINEKLEADSLCMEISSNYKGRKYLCPPKVGATSVLTLRKDGTGFFKSEYDELIH